MQNNLLFSPPIEKIAVKNASKLSLLFLSLTYAPVVAYNLNLPSSVSIAHILPMTYKDTEKWEITKSPRFWFIEANF